MRLLTTALILTVLYAGAASSQTSQKSAQPVGSSSPALPSATKGSLPSSTTISDKCGALAGTKVGDGEVERAERVARDASLSDFPFFASLKAGASFCRVRARLNPVPGSEVQVEVWLPDDWNGKFLGTGGGGYSGGIDAAPLTLGISVAKGYAAAATDAGHKSSDGARWALQQPEKVIDWAHRGNHVTAIFAKALIAAYYRRPAKRAYFQGCSNGGRDALMEARRYPDDYDGIIAGAPAANWTGMTSSFVWGYQSIFEAPDAAKLNTKTKLVQDAILNKCDALDGVKDGVLENPQLCQFDPAELQCKTGDGLDCLNEAEVGALRKIYQGPRAPDRRPIYSGFAIGSEDIPDNKQGWIDPSKAGLGAFGTEFYRWMVFEDPNWAPSIFRLDRDYPIAVRRMGPIVDSHDPDLRAFTRHGGKLIIYHGWDDGRIPAGASLDYYDTIRRRIGPAADQVRLFMVPGMAHCFGGPGPNSFDMLGQLDQWVEQGVAPERIIATKYDNNLNALLGRPVKALRTRPLCAWPKTAHYNGTGSTDEAANFTCKAAK